MCAVELLFCVFMCEVELRRTGILDYMCAVELLFCVFMCEVELRRTGILDYMCAVELLFCVCVKLNLDVLVYWTICVQLNCYFVYV